MRTQLALWLALAFTSSFALAQEKRSESDDSERAQPFVQQFSDAEDCDWEFGIKLNCSGGYASRTIVNAPVPIAWPEQEVELFEETKTSNVGKITIRKLGKMASYMAFAIPKLRNGDHAEAILRYRIKRKNTVRPDDTDQFSFAKKFTKRMKRNYLKPSPFIESKDEKIKAIGNKIFADSKDEPAWDQVEAVYSWVRENVQYKFDTEIHTCLEALSSGHGDCEELSSLFIAICRSQGVPARAVWVPGHTYPEFYLIDETGKGHWFPCQIAGADHEFGEMREDRPILQKGDRFKTQVNPKLSRYVKAGLKSDDATGVLSVDHIMRRSESSE